MAKIVQLILAALVAGIIARSLRGRNQPPTDDPTWPAWAENTEGATKPAQADSPNPSSADEGSWVEASSDGGCPTTHRVKVKLSSGIFHVPGQSNYERTNADRCYPSTEAAAADGFRASKV